MLMVLKRSSRLRRRLELVLTDLRPTDRISVVLTVMAVRCVAPVGRTIHGRIVPVTRGTAPGDVLHEPHIRAAVGRKLIHG